eukprot:6047088-Pyramimonas_sp.AAC.1
MAMIPKSVPGFRPIGVFPSPFRIWGRIRRPYAVAWEEANDRPYWAAGKHRSASDVVWRQSVTAERSAASGQHAGAIFYDMLKYYEQIPLALLELRGQRLNFPPVLMA